MFSIILPRVKFLAVGKLRTSCLIKIANHIVRMVKSQTSNFKPQSFRPDSFLLNGAQRNVFSPERSGGLFIEFCQHEVPSLMSCWMEANLFADSRHGTNDEGRSPRQNVFYLFFISPNSLS